MGADVGALVDVPPHLNQGCSFVPAQRGSISHTWCLSAPCGQEQLSTDVRALVDLPLHIKRRTHQLLLALHVSAACAELAHLADLHCSADGAGIAFGEAKRHPLRKKWTCGCWSRQRR